MRGIKPKFYRLIISVALVALIGLVSVQVYWFVAALRSSEREFDNRVNLSLRTVADKLLKGSGAPTEQIQPVRQTSAGSYFVEIGRPIDYALLDSILRSTFRFHEIALPFELSVHDASNAIVFGNIYTQGYATQQGPACRDREQEQKTMNFSITFPTRSQAIYGSMRQWIAAAVVFVAILVLFALLLYDLSRQKRLAELKNDFISNMTHELQTPIANISMAAEVLRVNRTIDEEKRMKYLGIIGQESRRLGNHVDQVLQAAALENGALVLLQERINLNQLVEAVTSEFETRVKRRNGQLERSIESANPWIQGDPTHLANVLYNLLDNADKYSPEKPTIRVSTRDENGAVKVSVEDNGIGIRSNIRKSIFEKFFRASGGNVHDVKGFGLGLSYVSMVVRAHNGAVSVTSRAETGSRFEVSLPAC